MIEIKVIGECGSGKSSIATLLAKFLADNGLSVDHVIPELENPIEVDRAKRNIDGLVLKPTKVVITEENKRPSQVFHIDTGELSDEVIGNLVEQMRQLVI